MREKVDLKNSMENITGTLMKRRVKILCMLVFSFVLALSLTGCAPKDDTADMPNLPQQEDTATPSEADNGGNENTVEIPQEEDTDKMVSVPVENLGRANPFVPAGVSIASSVPHEKLKYDVLEPLDTPTADPAAQKIVTTKVSGIMYDKSNPSAILNIEGTDYLVRSGDVINGYKVLSIGKSIVTVQMGSNIYKAGVGQLVNNGESVNYNQIANLNKKFGGAKK